MEKITVKMSKGDFIPANIYDKQLVIESLKEGGLYQAKITKPRNLKHHKKYWLLMNALSFHFGSTALFWHEDCKSVFLPNEERTNNITGQAELYVKSTAFDRLDQTAFDEYYRAIEDHLERQGYSIDELIEHSATQKV